MSLFAKAVQNRQSVVNLGYMSIIEGYVGSVPCLPPKSLQSSDVFFETVLRLRYTDMPS